MTQNATAGPRPRPASLSPADFYSAEAFERECVQRLRRSWVPVCRAEDVAETGAQKAVTLAGAPLLITRDRGGRLSALSNVCRHRAMTLVEGDARGEVIRCPYHLWTYELNGALAAAPFMDPDAVAGCDLPRYAVAEWGGWVFVDLGGAAAPLATLLAPLEADLQPALLATYRAGFRIALRHAWNWKVLVENFGESYHHIGAHAQTLQPIWPGGQTDATPSTAAWIDIRHPVHPAAGELRVLVVFPLLLLALTPADEGVVWYRLNPAGPEEIELEIVGLYPPQIAADAERMGQAEENVMAVHREDIVVCDRVQAGLHSPDAVLGPLSTLEDGIARFREWIG